MSDDLIPIPEGWLDYQFKGGGGEIERPWGEDQGEPEEKEEFPLGPWGGPEPVKPKGAFGSAVAPGGVMFGPIAQPSMTPTSSPVVVPPVGGAVGAGGEVKAGDSWMAFLQFAELTSAAESPATPLKNGPSLDSLTAARLQERGVTAPQSATVGTPYVNAPTRSGTRNSPAQGQQIFMDINDPMLRRRAFPRRPTFFFVLRLLLRGARGVYPVPRGHKHWDWLTTWIKREYIPKETKDAVLDVVDRYNSNLKRIRAMRLHRLSVSEGISENEAFVLDALEERIQTLQGYTDEALLNIGAIGDAFIEWGQGQPPRRNVRNLLGFVRGADSYLSEKDEILDAVEGTLDDKEVELYLK